MSDYSGIGDAMIFLAVLAAFAVPVAIGGIIGLIFSVCGLTNVGIAFGVVGFLTGIFFATKVASS